MKLLVLALAVLGLATGAWASGADKGDLTLLDSAAYPAAKCLDGSPAGYYFRNATKPDDVDNWIIFLEGGGECVTRETCQSRSKTSLGSSTGWKPARGFYALQDTDPTRNPNFSSWNMILVPYCSGDLFLGQDDAANERAYGLQFSGSRIVSAIVDAAARNLGLLDAARVIVSGASAGGIGAVAQADRVSDQLSSLQQTAALAASSPAAAAAVAALDPTLRPLRVRPSPVRAVSPRFARADTKFYLIPIAGSYFDGSVTYNGTAPAPVPFIPWSFADLAKYSALWNAAVPERCAAARPQDPWACIFSVASYPTMQTPFFAVQAQTDAIVVSLHAGLPEVWNPPSQTPPRPCFNTMDPCPAEPLEYLIGWSERMYTALSPVLDGTYPAAGAFFSACLLHTEFESKKPLIKGKNYLQAAWAWVATDATGRHVHIDNCQPGEIFCGQCSA